MLLYSTAIGKVVGLAACYGLVEDKIGLLVSLQVQGLDEFPQATLMLLELHFHHSFTILSPIFTLPTKLKGL